MQMFFTYLDRPWARITASLAVVWFIAFLTPARENFSANLQENIANMPYFDIDFHAHRPSRHQFNSSKLALMMEGKPKGTTAPLILHTMAVAPPDWPFLFLGSTKSVAALLSSRPVRDYVATGKLVVQAATNYDLSSLEGRTQALTTLDFYRKYVDPAEWLFTFDSKSMLCASSAADLDQWLGYDWVAPPWEMRQHNGGSEWDRLPGRKYRDAYNGGVSIRRVSRAKRVLEFQERPEFEYDDVFFMDRLPSLPGSRILGKDNASQFVMKDQWSPQTLGLSIADFEKSKDGVWNKKKHRLAIWDYCSAVKMIMPMELEIDKYRCGKPY